MQQVGGAALGHGSREVAAGWLASAATPNTSGEGPPAGSTHETGDEAIEPTERTKNWRYPAPEVRPGGPHRPG